MTNIVALYNQTLLTFSFRRETDMNPVHDLLLSSRVAQIERQQQANNLWFQRHSLASNNLIGVDIVPRRLASQPVVFLPRHHQPIMELAMVAVMRFVVMLYLFFSCFLTLTSSYMKDFVCFRFCCNHMIQLLFWVAVFPLLMILYQSGQLLNKSTVSPLPTNISKRMIFLKTNRNAARSAYFSSPQFVSVYFLLIFFKTSQNSSGMSE